MADEISIREYVDMRFNETNRAMQTALDASEKAILKAENATEKRFEATNEFRQQLSDQTNTFIPRLEYDVQHKALEDKVSELTDRINTGNGITLGSALTKSDIYRAVGLGVAILGFVLSFVVLMANNKV